MPYWCYQMNATNEIKTITHRKNKSRKNKENVPRLFWRTVHRKIYHAPFQNQPPLLPGHFLPKHSYKPSLDECTLCKKTRKFVTSLIDNSSNCTQKSRKIKTSYTLALRKLGSDKNMLWKKVTCLLSKCFIPFATSEAIFNSSLSVSLDQMLV